MHSLNSLFIFLTDIGDSAVICGVVFVSCIFFVWLRCYKSALAVMASLILVSAEISLVKIAFLGCMATRNNFNISSPSGHTALSVAVYGTLTILFCHQLRGILRTLLIIIAVFLISAIAVTRVLLGLHTTPEVLLGLILGELSLILVAKLLQRIGYAESFDARKLVILGIVAGSILHGFRLPAEDAIHVVANYFGNYMGCVHL